MITKKIRVYGIVQGVGFRPTVSRHAAAAGITGSVCNKGPYVEIFAQGSEECVNHFIKRIQEQPPKRAVILKMDVESLESAIESDTEFEVKSEANAESDMKERFCIIESEKEEGEIFVSPDIAICPECKKELYDKKIVFSDEARYELNVLIAAMKEIVTSTVQAFSRDDLQMAARIEPLRELIGMLCDELKMRHVDRLQSGKCGISQGFAFNDLLTNIERVSDHCSNVAVAMIELESRNFDTHEYLKSLREMRNTEYKRYFEEYEQKYSIDDFEAWSERQQEKEKMKALLEEQQLQQGRKSKNVGTAETIIPENIDPLEDPLEDTEEN